MCDKPHPLPLLKPVACDSELCNYQMADLGLGVNLESEVQRNPMVIDLLISSAYSAAFGKNKYTTFPFEGGAETVVNVLTKCPSLMDMTSVIGRGNSLRSFLENIDPLLYKVVRWVIASNASDIQPISREGRVRDMPEHQFLLNSSTPASEARFQELKAKNGMTFLQKKPLFENFRLLSSTPPPFFCHTHYITGGSFFAFHGSALSSWHNILRGGLKKLDLRTAYGPGIYMATNASTSLGYMTPAKSFPNSKLGSQLRIMALCEVCLLLQNHALHGEKAHGIFGETRGFSILTNISMCLPACLPAIHQGVCVLPTSLSIIVYTQVISEGSEKNCNGRVHRPKCEHNKQCPHIRVEAEESVVTRVLFLFTDNQSTYNIEAKNITIPSVDRIGKPLGQQSRPKH